jgi:alkylation response protein AidB-like acyl-CoA dehydrogenase
MDIGFSEEQELLRDTARKFLDSECPTSFVRRMMASEEAVTGEFWRKLAEQGWLGITYAEADGGSGLGLVDLVVLMEEVGRAVMPGPYPATVLLGGAAIAEAGSATQRQEWLPRVAAGEAKATLAATEPNARWDAAGITASARETRGGFALAGTKLFVPDAHQADVLVVAARSRDGSTMEDGISLFLVPKDTAGVAVRLLPSVDETRKLCEVRLDNVALSGAALLGDLHQGWAPLGRVIDRAAVALSAEMCGAAQRVLDMTVDYAKLRQAFGKPIGSYQGVKHKCADMLVEIENAKSLTYYAAWAVDEGEADAAMAVSMAKAAASDAGRKVCAAGIQLHGGIGMTWEHDLQLYLKRAKASEIALGDATWHRERIARLLGA